MSNRQTNLYLLVLVSISGVILVGLGGGLFNQQSPWQIQWQHEAFSNLCHQNPARSFWINGQPMAVCSRCLGIYAGFGIGWLTLPLYAIANMAEKWNFKKGAMAIVLINIFDIVGNILGFWENTLVSRLALGCMMGMSAALIFSGDFFKTIIKSKGNHYGRVTATDR